MTMDDEKTTGKTVYAYVRVKNGQITKVDKVPEYANKSFIFIEEAKVAGNSKLSHDFKVLKANVRDLLAAIDTVDRNPGDDFDHAA